VFEANPAEAIGDLIRRARRARGQSQQQLADYMNRLSGRDTVTGHEVRRWEGHHRIPRPYARRWLSEALDIPASVLDRAAMVAAVQRSARAAPEVSLSLDNRIRNVVSANAAVTLEEVLAMWDEMVGRRELLARAGPVAGLALIASTLPGGLQLGTSDFSRELYEAHAELTARYRQIDNMTGPLSVYSLVASSGGPGRGLPGS
jgi:transcriptional regulator with XRE-family HTH domain